MVLNSSSAVYVVLGNVVDRGPVLDAIENNPYDRGDKSKIYVLISSKVKSASLILYEMSVLKFKFSKLLIGRWFVILPRANHKLRFEHGPTVGSPETRAFYHSMSN